MIAITDAMVISEHEIEERFVRAPGPGGQRVNKVETRTRVIGDCSDCTHSATG